MESLTKKKKGPNQTAIVVVMMIMATVLGCMTIVDYQNSYSIKEDTNIEVPEETTTEEEIINTEAIEANKKISKLQYAITYALNEIDAIDSRKNTEIIYSDAEKIKFTFATISLIDNEDNIKRNTNSEGQNIAGYLGINKDYFKKIYTELFTNPVDETTLANIYTEKDNYIYGSVSVGLVLSNTTFKLNSFTQDGDTYNIIIDVLKDNTNNSEYAKYFGDNVVEYPDSLVSYSIKLSVTKAENLYKINSMVAY